jgi:hypothetical protein
VDEGTKLDARTTPYGAEAFIYSEGSGRDAYGSYLTLRLEKGSCIAQGFETEGPKEWLDSGLHRAARGGAMLPTLQQVAEWSDSLLVQDDARPELAAARLLTQLTAREAEGPRRWPAQPEHPGRPRGSPAAIWTPEMLRAAGVERPWLHSDGGTRFDGIHHGRVREPRLLAQKGDFEIWELRFRARNGGGLVAVYDRARDRHRWLWGTHGDWPKWDGRGALDAKSFTVEKFEGDKLVLRTEFERVVTRVAIDLRSGAIRETSSAAPSL